MNQRVHWEATAPSYNEEIFDVFKSDKYGRLQKAIKRHGGSTKRALDFGCGNGKAFELLSPNFKSILAIDISGGLLKQAQSRKVSNVTFKRLDLARKLKLPRVDFVFSCNVIMLPEMEKNMHMLQNIYRALPSGGSAVLVLPALESALYANLQLINLYEKDGIKIADIPKSELLNYNAPKTDIIKGLVHIHGVPTKHYSEPEVVSTLHKAGLLLTKLSKLEYDWNTEIASPPKSMGAPYPWDWMVECVKK